MAHNELLGLAAHKLRTPATVIKQYLGLLLDGYTEPLTSKQRQLIKKAYDSNERQLRVINDLLCVVNATTGVVALNLEQTNLIDLIEKTIEEHRTQLIEKRQHVQGLPGEPAYAVVDPFFLSIAVNNLLSSSIQHTPEGRTIVVELAVKPSVLSVTFRNGTKATTRTLPRLLKRLPRNTGSNLMSPMADELGLYFAERVARLHGGILRKNLDADNGLTVTLVVPTHQGKKHYSTERQPSYNHNIAL